MAIAWTRKIKEKKILNVYPTDLMTQSGIWGTYFPKALDTLNAFLAKYKIAVAFKPTDIPPARDGMGGAEVQVSLSTGKHSYWAFGSEYQGTMPPGSASNGRCHHVQYNDYIAKAFIFLPSGPVISTASEVRTPGSGILNYLFLHELVHSLGLEDEDPGHFDGTRRDIFRSWPGFDYGDTPEGGKGKPGDRIKISDKILMPAYDLSPTTVKLIKTNWE
jgi:hypothetical protein